MNKKIVTIVAIVSIVAVMAVMFAGCASAYQSNLERAGFDVKKIEAKDFEDQYALVYGALKDLKIKYAVAGAKADEGLAITIVGFDKAIESETAKSVIAKFGKVSKDGKTIMLSTSDRAIKAAETGILDKKN